MEKMRQQEQVAPGEASARYKNFFFTVRTITDWNNLPWYVVESPSLGTVFQHAIGQGAR